jgi:hypothetical protein
MPDRIHHRTADLPGQLGVASAPSPGLQRGQVLKIDNGRAEDVGLVYRPAGSSPRQGVVEAADPRANPLMLDVQDRVLGGQRRMVRCSRRQPAEQPSIVVATRSDRFAVAPQPPQLRRDTGGVEA